MYRLAYSFLLLLASFILSHSRQTVFTSRNGLSSHLPDSAEPGVCMTPKCVTEASNVLTSLDETVDPCDDFYHFACGGWLKRHYLEENELEIHPVMEMINVLNRNFKELLERKYESSEPPFVKKLKDFYSSCADMDSIEKDGSEPLKQRLSRLGGWPVIEGNDWDESTFDWVDSLISLRELGYDHNILMKLDVDSESSNKLINIIHLGVPEHRVLGGLDDPKIAAYFRLMVKAAKLLGSDEFAAEKELQEVLNFTIAMENIISLSGGINDSESIVTVQELQKKVPQIPWLKYFNGLCNGAVNENDTIKVENMDFVTKLAELITSTKKRVIANYMMMRTALESSEFLSEEWISIDEELDKLHYEEREKSRWKYCVMVVAKEMGIALSSYYVKHYFNEESKDKVIILVKYLQKEFLKILEETDWMDEKTRKTAEEKANAIESYVGFPKELLDDTFMGNLYGNLRITTDSYLENVMALHKMAIDREFLSLGKPSDLKSQAKFDFNLEVNAFYSPEVNSIIIPAAILHDYFYDEDRPNYMNFGGIGFVIGHEITHGFDNEGRKWDKEGNYVNWWDKESDEHFRKKVLCIIDQYSNYTTDIGLKVNGETTQNENIADNGGMKEAYWAYSSWTKDNGIEPTLPGLNYTQNQLFWISAAHVWCEKNQPIMLKAKLLTDNHSPKIYRIIGPMSNLEEFSKDFKCSADSPMNRKYKCKVW